MKGDRLLTNSKADWCNTIILQNSIHHDYVIQGRFDAFLLQFGHKIEIVNFEDSLCTG